MGALIEIGALINKNTFEGGAYSKGAIIGRRALNRIITVFEFSLASFGIRKSFYENQSSGKTAAAAVKVTQFLGLDLKKMQRGSLLHVASVSSAMLWF